MHLKKRKEKDAGEELLHPAEEEKGGGGEAGVPQEQAQWRVDSQVSEVLHGMILYELGKWYIVLSGEWAHGFLNSSSWHVTL